MPSRQERSFRGSDGGPSRLEGRLGAGQVEVAYTTDLDLLFKRWMRLTERFDSRFATGVIGVTELPAPQLLVMLEATAID